MNLTGDHPPVFTPEGPWTFHNPVKVHFGRGVREQLAEQLTGTLCLIVTTQRGRRQLMEDPLLGAFAADPAHIWIDTVTENPGLGDLQHTIDSLADRKFEAVLGFGGGSAIDSAKVIAVALSSECAGVPLSDLLARPDLQRGARPKRLYAVPTTAGTGSEVTPFSTVWDHERLNKHSLTGTAVFPYAAYVDPALTDTVPSGASLSTGLDAINQAAESIWNKNATPITLELATRSLQLGLMALRNQAGGSVSSAARDQMAESSLLAGLAISHTRTALCHAVSYPITMCFGVPHGLACAFTMSAVLRYNLRRDDGRIASAAIRISPDGTPRTMITEVDRLLTDNGVAEQVRKQVGSEKALIALADRMMMTDRANNNLADVTISIIEEILFLSWNDKF